MELIESPQFYKQVVEKSINKYGYAPEHNLYWYRCSTEQKQEAVIVTWPNNKMLLTQKGRDDWYIFSEPLIPLCESGEKIIQFTKYALNTPGINKVVLELRKDTRKEILSILPKQFKACSINYTLIWPIMNLEKFDPALSGHHFKKIRNARNKFQKEHRIRTVDAKNLVKADLYKLVDSWREKRKGRDRTFCHEYLNLIDNEFIGCKSARGMIVDGRLVGLNAGWEIPNSDFYYAAVGLHDYSVNDLGILLYLEDLEWIKKAGYKHADMGGGEKALTDFKNQFLPESWYKTFIFSIIKRKNMPRS